MRVDPFHFMGEHTTHSQSLRVAASWRVLAAAGAANLIICTFLIIYSGESPHDPEFDEKDIDYNNFAESMSSEEIVALKEGQQILLEMFRVFDGICRRHSIRYWSVGGTLGGAVLNKVGANNTIE